MDSEKSKCYICDKTYLNEKNLQDHVKRLHEKAKSYECGRCKKTFTRMSNLNRHFANIHGKTSFNCDLCGNKFTQKYNLTHHISRIHHQNRPYECEICRKRYLGVLDYIFG